MSSPTSSPPLAAAAPAAIISTSSTTPLVAHSPSSPAFDPDYDSGDHHHPQSKPQSSKTVKPNDPSCDSPTVLSIVVGLLSIIASATGSRSTGPVGSINIVGSISTGIKPSNLLINSAHQVSRCIIHRDLILFEKFGFMPSGGINIILSGVFVLSESASSLPLPDLSLLGFFLLSDDPLPSSRRRALGLDSGNNCINILGHHITISY